MFIAATIALLAAPSYAQSSNVYASFSGGFAVSPDGTSGDVLGEVGVRIAPHLSVFGNLGQFHNLQPSQVQPAVDAVVATLAAGGLSVTGVARVPAWYSMGGLRWTVPVNAPRVALRVRRPRVREAHAEREVHLFERHAGRRDHAAGARATT